MRVGLSSVPQSGAGLGSLVLGLGASTPVIVDDVIGIPHVSSYNFKKTESVIKRVRKWGVK